MKPMSVPPASESDLLLAMEQNLAEHACHAVALAGAYGNIGYMGPGLALLAFGEKKGSRLYIEGEEVYAKAKADALEADLSPLVGGGLVTRLAKHDTNPANNPQPPARYRG